MQLLGDAVLEVACQRPDDIRPAARRCVAALRDRDWEGDAELADQIESAFGWGPTPLLKRLPVDLEELAGVLEGDPLTGGGRIDLHTGEVWPQAAIEYADDVGERWLHVLCEGSRAGYRDMEIFIDNLEDDRLADRLARAIRGAERSAGSRTSWPTPPTFWSAGTASATTATEGEPGRGSPARGTPRRWSLRQSPETKDSLGRPPGSFALDPGHGPTPCVYGSVPYNEPHECCRRTAAGRPP